MADPADVLAAVEAAAGVPLAAAAWLGRSGQGNTVLLAGADVGDNHLLAALDTYGRGWIVDLGSGQPTWLERDGLLHPVNGQPVEVGPGDRVWVGPYRFSWPT